MKELPAARERLGATAIGEQAEVADALEAGGHDVEQEAAQEFLGRQCHDLRAMVIGVVAPTEVDDAVVQGQDSLVADRDAMGVAAEVGEHLCGAAEGWLGVDHPGRAVQGAQQGARCGGLLDVRLLLGRTE